MRLAFDAVMRVVTGLIGLIMILSGSVWMMQGLGVGPDAIMRGFMVDDIRWTFYGALLAIVGIAEIVWSIMRSKL